MEYEKLFQELVSLNPHVIIVRAEYDRGFRIYSSVHGSKLRLPKGFEYDEKEGITNKNHPINGKYISIKVLPFEKVKSNESNKEDNNEEIDENNLSNFIEKEKNIVFNKEAMMKLKKMPDLLVGKDGKVITYNTKYCAIPNKTFTYGNIESIMTNINNGVIGLYKLKNEYGFSSYEQLQSAYNDIAKKASIDYINANINLLYPLKNTEIKLKNPGLINMNIVNWYTKFGNRLKNVKINNEQVKMIYQAFRNNPGKFLENASSYSLKNTNEITKNISLINNMNNKIFDKNNLYLKNDQEKQVADNNNLSQSNLSIKNNYELTIKNGSILNKAQIIKNEKPNAANIQKVRNTATSALKKLYNNVQTKAQTKGVGTNAKNR